MDLEPTRTVQPFLVEFWNAWKREDENILSLSFTVMYLWLRDGPQGINNRGIYPSLTTRKITFPKFLSLKAYTRVQICTFLLGGSQQIYVSNKV